MFIQLPVNSMKVQTLKSKMVFNQFTDENIFFVYFKVMLEYQTVLDLTRPKG